MWAPLYRGYCSNFSISHGPNGRDLIENAKAVKQVTNDDYPVVRMSDRTLCSGEYVLESAAAGLAGAIYQATVMAALAPSRF